MGGDGRSSGERGAWEAASLVFRIATVGLSLASAIMTAASTQCVLRDDGSAAGTVSYGDYGSFKYSALADLLSAVLQMVAIFLEVVGKEKWAGAVELIDKLVLALTSTSAPLLLAADDITSCGGPRRGARRQARGLDDKLRPAAYASLGPLASTAANEIVKKLRRHKKQF
ncbi:CASP-like protein 1U3 [Panicum virgatum]|uniref:CASP-like protein 1U3 n=1 Tax=Panicum virgatum TaxID=38727 RepID=UPI0019D5718A|nr:CASP-like protein 1U3 [Panicum virgatum]